LLAYLNRLPELIIPPSLLKALKRWEQHGTQAALENATLLRVDSPDMLAALQKSPAARYISEVLNPTTVLIHPGQIAKVRAALIEMGYLVN